MSEVKKECNNCKFYKGDGRHIMQGICRIHNIIRTYKDTPSTNIMCNHYEWRR